MLRLCSRYKIGTLQKVVGLQISLVSVLRLYEQRDEIFLWEFHMINLLAGYVFERDRIVRFIFYRSRKNRVAKIFSENANM